MTMSDFVIPRKSSVSLKFLNSFSPNLPESPISKSGETARAGELLKQVTDRTFEESLVNVGASLKNLVLQATARQSFSNSKTILKTSSRGGLLRGLGGKIVDGARTMKNFQIKVATLDNKKIFKSVGTPRKVAKQHVKMLSKKEQEALFQSYIVQRQKLKPSFQPKVKQAEIAPVDLAPKPKVSKNTIICSHMHRMIKNPHGPATLMPCTKKRYL